MGNPSTVRTGIPHKDKTVAHDRNKVNLITGFRENGSLKDAHHQLDYV